MRLGLKIKLFSLSLSLALAGCVSGRNDPLQPPSIIIPPPAWVMEPPSNLLLIMDEIFLIATKQSS